LPPKGVASGNPVITGVKGYGKAGFILLGQDLDRITLYKDGGNSYLWVNLGKHMWVKGGSGSYPSQGGWILFQVPHVTKTKITVQIYGAFSGPVTVRAVANAAGWKKGATVKETGLPSQVIFATGTKK
jgi:hypothetical protein